METKKYYVVTDGELLKVDHDTYQKWMKHMTTDGIIAKESLGDNTVVTTFNGEDAPAFFTSANDGPAYVNSDFKSAMEAHEELCAKFLKSEENK